MDYLKILQENHGIHTEADSLVRVVIADKTWYNLCTGFDGKNTFKGETETFTDIRKAVNRWKELTMDCFAIYNECLIKDNKKLALMLEDSWFIYQYCLKIKDRIELAKKISNPMYAMLYCLRVKDRKVTRDMLTDLHALDYCEKIKDTLAMRKRITSSKGAYFYCKNVKDRPSVRKFITDPHWKYLYKTWKNEAKRKIV